MRKNELIILCHCILTPLMIFEVGAGQEAQTSRPITRANFAEYCPAIPDPTERQVRQLDILVKLDVERERREATARGNEDSRTNQPFSVLDFSLLNQDDSNLLKALIGGGGKIGSRSLEALFASLGPPSVGWLVSQYDSVNIQIKVYIIHVMERLEAQEVYSFLTTRLDEKIEVTNMHAQAVAPPGYRHLRICDLACNALTFKLTRQDAGFQSVVKERYIASLTPIAERDRRISEVKGLIAQHPKEYGALLDKLPKLVNEVKEKAEKDKGKQ